MRVKFNNKYKLIWIITGTISLVWFLIRVIPKPSRAGYPCQRAAFPIASSFVIWLSSLFLSVNLIIKAKKLFRKKAFVFGFILASGAFFTFHFLVTSNYLKANDNGVKYTNDFTPVDEDSGPMGNSFGLYPGRVIWNHNPNATSWNGSDGFFWENNNTDLNEVNKMLSESIDALTGATTNAASWRLVFENFNQRKNRGDSAYVSREKIAIKLNLSNSDTHGSIYDNHGMSSPQLVLSLIRQLVYEAGIPDSCITLYDVSQKIPALIYDPCVTEFPKLRFIDESGGDGRMKYVVDSSKVLQWSQDLVLEDGGGHTTYLPKCVTEADYLINIGILKGHDMAGISMCGKNHVGTIIASNPDQPQLSSPRAAGIHPYATVHYFDYWNLPARPMASYNTIVDLMGHEDLGNKTLLYIIDGLYASKAQNGSASIPNKWFMAPFNNDWPSSIFISQDNVAIESVCLDFLRSEPTMMNVYGNVDNYLHEAALANDPPSKVFYDPEGDGSQLAGLGVHEHWNNAEDKIYTGNVISGQGIELVQLYFYKIEDLSFNVPPGEYNEPVSLEIHTPTENVDIYYTLDGAYPDTTKTLFTGSIVLSESATIYAMAYRNGYEPSSLLKGEFEIINTGNLFNSIISGIEIYPTICRENIKIAIKDNDPGMVTIQVYDLKGKTLVSRKIEKNSTLFIEDVNLSSLPGGYYLVKVLFNGKYISQKILKKAI